jgi:peroxiredoxin Q/BCP
MQKKVKYMLANGTKAPDFSLKNQDFIEISLKDLIGKWVILYFYPKDNTPGCTTEACNFSDEIENFENLNAIILGVSPDSVKKHRNFIEKKDLKITLLADETKEVAVQYKAWGLKKLYGKEYEGIIRSTYIINPEGNIAHSWTKVRVKNHVDEVKKVLENLQNK